MKWFWKSSLNNLSKTFRFIYSNSPKWTILHICAASLMGILPLVLIYFIKILIDVVSQTIQQADTSGNIDHLIWVIVGTGIVFFLNSSFGSLLMYIREKNTRVIEDMMYKKIQDKTSSLDLEYYENPYYHDIIFRAEQESKYRPQQILNGLVMIIQNAISLLLVAILLTYFHYLILVLLIVSILPAVIVKFRYNEAYFRLSRKYTPELRKINYFHRILTEKVFTKEIRLFGLSGYFREQFSFLRITIWKLKNKLLINKTVWEVASHFVAAAAIFGAFAYMTKSALKGHISIGDLVMYFLVIRRGFNFIRGILEGFTSLYEQNLFLKNLFEFLNLKPIVQSKNPIQKPFKEPFEIQVKNLSFSYPNTNRIVLKNVSFEIPKGKTIAFVGQNGAGKTTLTKIISRFYDPDKGSICFNNIDLKNIEQKAVFASISVLFQDFILYHLTAGNNIWFGNVNKPYDVEAIRQASRQAGVDDVIMKLPKKYETFLGNLFEESAELSIGEWQKLALARAYFRDAGLYILDEPTSSLDPKTEAELFQRFKSLIKGKTAIIISHRFNTIKMADYIYVFDNHTIIESGTHKELMALNGKYAKMYLQQAKNFRID